MTKCQQQSCLSGAEVRKVVKGIRIVVSMVVVVVAVVAAASNNKRDPHQL